MSGKYLFVMTLCWHYVINSAIPVSIETTLSSLLAAEDPIEDKNKTIDDNIMEERQTETIKRVVAEHQDITPEYPVLMRYDPQRELDKIPIEQLKKRCQQLSRLFDLNNKTEQTVSIRPPNHRYPEIQEKPVYYPTRPPTFRPIRYPPQATLRPHGFYVTAQTSTTRKPVTTTEQQAAPVKYIRLEPVILQKTILADGRTVYLWHKSLPTAVQYSPSSYFPNVQGEGQNIYDHNNPGKLTYSPQYGYYNQNQQLYANNYVRPVQIVTKENSPQVTTQSSTTTTTEDSNSYGYGFSNFIPFYSYRQESSSSSTTEPSTTTTTTIKPPLETGPNGDLLYAQQLKFVVPVPIDDDKGGIPIRNPWNFDPYVYYPKPLQPSTVNVKVPYNPMFHVISAVKVPTLENKENVDID